MATAVNSDRPGAEDMKPTPNGLSVAARTVWICSRSHRQRLTAEHTEPASR